MLTVHRFRGLISNFVKCASAAAVAFSAIAVAAYAADSKQSAADLATYASEDGQTFFALSVMPPADAQQSQPRDIVILFDTSASQTGVYRETSLAALEAFVAKLGPKDRVQLFAADLEARPITKSFVAAGSAEMKAAVESLRNEPPLGSTDMENVLRTVAAKFDKDRPEGRALIYIGDGVSSANLLGTDSFRTLVSELTSAHIPVSSYAIGPQTDGRLLAALANQTGGNLYVAEQMAFANEMEKVTGARANDENTRRGGAVGATLADWAHATVYWPTNVVLPSELGQVYPKTLTPLRSDRDTVAIGAVAAPLDKPLEIKGQFVANGKPVELSWTAAPQAGGEAYAFLPKVVQIAKADDGITLPSVGSAGLAETGRAAEASVDGLTDLAERAVATGDAQAAQVASQAILARDPGNIKAKTVQRVVEKQRTQAKPVAQAGAPVPPQPAAAAPVVAPAAAPSNELNLVRQPAALPPQAGGAVQELPTPAVAGPPAVGSLTDQFAGDGALLDQVQENRRVFGQMLRREVENAVIDARKTMSSDPAQAMQDLKLTLQNVDRAPELTPEVRAQLKDKLQIALREAQHEAIVKDERDAEREEQFAAARERRMLNDRMARNHEKEKQLVDRFNSLIDERRYDEALEVASTLQDVDPNGVVPVVTLVSTELRRNDYLMQVTRAARWTRFFDTLYEVEKSSVPFPDDPPIVYPAAPVWEELSNRRKDRYGAMDLKATGEAEQRIEKALRSPLHAAGLEFAEVPLKEVVTALTDDYGIPIKLDQTALEEIGLSSDEVVNVTLRNITLRSALRLMLKDLQLTYIIQDEVLMITTPQKAEENLVVKVYPVADLVLPIDATLLGGQGGGGIGGGGIGGQGGGGGGFGGQGGGGGGFGGGGGGFGGGGGGFGGGGQFSVPDNADDSNVKAPAKISVPKPAVAAPKAEASAEPMKKVAAIAVDASQKPDVFWNAYFKGQRADSAAVRETVRQLMAKKQLDQVIALINAALSNGQPQPWMYESLGIAMQLNGSSNADIERTIMSAADFSTSADELMYIAKYLSRLGLDRRAMLVYQQVAKVEPLRSEAYAAGLRAAERANDLAGIRWATVGILSQAWPTNMAEIELSASRIAKATLERLASEGNDVEREAYLKELQEAVVRDCVVRVSWTGEADIDFSVEEPSGSTCSVFEPRTAGGGVKLGDSYAVEGKPNNGSSEVYVCPKGFAGTYRVQIRRVWGEVAAGKVTVDVYTHLRSGDMQHERQQLAVTDKDAMVIFDLNKGRRSDPIELAQLAGAIKRQENVSRSVLAQQINNGSDPGAAPNRSALGPLFEGQRRALLGGGAVGFQPIVQTLTGGPTLIVSGVVSADRRYVRIAAVPSFNTIGDVQTFTFAGRADPVAGGGTGTGTGTGTGAGAGAGTGAGAGVF